MENVRKSPGYAESQIRLLLSELGNPSHAVRLKAIKHFQTYIETYRPEIFDDDVDFLYTGFNSEANTYTTSGLLHYCGLKSDKHDGQLKRICGPAVGLVRWLITFKGYEDNEGGNVFYDRFMQLKDGDLLRINFAKHMLPQEKESNLLKMSAGGERSGSAEDAMEILSFLVRDHRGPNGDPDPVDLNALIDGNKTCREKFLKWLQKTAQEQINQVVSLESLSNKKVIKVERPRTWDSVVLKTVPLQEDEAGLLDDKDDAVADTKTPVPDPLGLQDIDLRLAQELHDSAVSKTRVAAGGDMGPGHHPVRKASLNLNPIDKMAIMARVERDDASADDEHEPEGREDFASGSLLPMDKAFSPVLFLTFLHSNATFQELLDGSENLEKILQEQSSRRVNIVREHFGLFVLCAEGLEWLKLVRKAGGDAANEDEDGHVGLGSIGNRLSRAQGYLSNARFEAQSALAPLLFRHKRSREIRKAEQELKNISTIVDVPSKMLKAFDDGSYDEVCAIYSKVVKMAKARVSGDTSSSAHIIDRVKAKADDTIDELKGRCESLMKVLGSVPSVDDIIKFWRVLCALDMASTVESGEADAAAQLGYLRSSFDFHMSQFVAVFKKHFDNVQVVGAQALLEGQVMNVDESLGMLKSEVPSKLMRSGVLRDFEEGPRRREQRLLEDGYATESSSGSNDGEHTDTDVAASEQMSSADGQQRETTDHAKKLCGDVRVATLRRVVDSLEEWLPGMHDLAQVVATTTLAQTGGTGAAGKRSAAATTKTSPVVTLAKEVARLSVLCVNLLKGMSDSAVQWGGGDLQTLRHPNFTSPLDSRHAAAAYDEVFSAFELLSALNLASQPQNDSLSARAGAVPKSTYADALALLKELSVEGELLTASHAMKALDLKHSVMQSSLLDAMGATHSAEGHHRSSTALKLTEDFENLTLRSLRKLYGLSNRPEWIVELVKTSVSLGLVKLLGALDKAVLQGQFQDPAPLHRLLETGDLDLDSIEELVREADASHAGRACESVFDTLRACVFLRLRTVPRVLQEILVTRVAPEVSEQRRGSRRASFTIEETEVALRAMQGATDEFSAAVLRLEASVVIRYLELKSWDIRHQVSLLYFNLIAHYEELGASAPEFPLVTVLLLLAKEKESLEAVFSEGSFLGDDETEEERPASRLYGYTQILFAELCKQVSGFYVDVVLGIFTGTAFNVLDVAPTNGITLPLWHKRGIVPQRRSDVEKKLLLPKTSQRAKTGGPAMTTCPWPLLFERAVCESSYLASMTKRMVDKAAKCHEDAALKAIPVTDVQIEVDADAFYGVLPRSGQNLSRILEDKLKSLSILLT